MLFIKAILLGLVASVLFMDTAAYGNEEQIPPITPLDASPHLVIQGAKVELLEDLDLLVFSMNLEGRAGGVVPERRGGLAGAPVLGYVFPTSLKSQDVGFGETEGIVALAITSHPDFDDTPLWDEDGDRDYANDGVVFHPHWVVLVPDERVPGGLAVKQFKKAEAVILPPTNPGMPMYMDSPGFSVVMRDNRLRVLVPTQRVRGQVNFKFDAVSVYMQVMPEGDFPLLGVYKVYSLLSGNLSLPYSVTTE